MENHELLKAMEELLDRKLDQKLDQKLKPIHRSIDELKEDVRTLKTDMVGVKADISSLKEKVIKLENSDVLILDEIERVHEIMLRRTDELKKQVIG